MSALPKDDAEKEYWRLQRAEIRRILMNHWDPIGVKDIADAQDEYDSYIGAVTAALRNNTSLADIEHYLRYLVRDHMGLSRDDINYADLMPKLAALRLGA